MAVRPVLRLPEGVLSQPCRPAGPVDDVARRLADDLVDTMRASPACVGLAANQIGVPVRAFVVDVTGHRHARSCAGLIVLFDPEIVDSSGTVMAREGCMSVPDLTGDVARAGRVVVEGTDPEGRRCRLEVAGFEARAVQHELDHLNGVLFLDKVGSDDRVFRRRVYR